MSTNLTTDELARRDRAVATLLTMTARDNGLPSWTMFAPVGGADIAYAARLRHAGYLAVFTPDLPDDLTLGRVVEVAVYDADRWEDDEHPESVAAETCDNLVDAMSWLAEFTPDDHA